jgi:hypothetical protein
VDKFQLVVAVPLTPRLVDLQRNSAPAGASMLNATGTYTVIVVSHADLRRHEDVVELINIPGYERWKRPYHECTFTLDPSGTQDIDSQMRQVNPLSVPR